MKALSRRSLVLGLVSMGFLMAGSALLEAQPHFILGGTPAMVRMHGQAEVLGDLVLMCDVPGVFPAGTTMTVTYHPVYAIVNAADGTQTFATAGAVAAGARTAYVQSEPATSPIVIGPAVLTPSNDGIMFPISGSAAKGDIIHVLGVRANLGEANLPSNSAVTALITVTPPNGLQIENVNSFPVAFSFDEIGVTLVNTDPPGVQVSTMKVFERIPNALTSVTEENDPQHTPANVAAKPAAHGTQIQVTILNVLPGIHLEWKPTVVGTDSILKLALLDPSTTSFTNTGPTAVPSVSFTYEVVADDEASAEEVDIPVSFSLVRIPYSYIAGSMYAQIRLGPNAGTNFSSTIPSNDILSFANNPPLGDDPPPTLSPPSGTHTTRSESGGFHREGITRRF